MFQASRLTNTLNWICGFSNTLINKHAVEQLRLPTIVSDMPNTIETSDRKIILVQQFFIHKDSKRQKEILETLTMNIHNESIDEIHLINERFYSEEELGSKSKKIKQVVDSGTRLTYKDVMKYSMDYLDNAIVVLANSDIFFDRSISQCKTMDLTNAMICLSRYKLNGRHLKNAQPEIFNGWSQDTWIWSSNTLFNDKELEKCNFNLGKPGCDNRMAFLSSEMGLSVYNIPNVIKSYHHHKSEVRNYSHNDRIDPPRYLALLPPIIRRPSITTFLPANDAQYLLTYFNNYGCPTIINAKSDDMVLLRRGFLSLNDSNLNITVDDVKYFVVHCSFILIDIPYRLTYHPRQTNMCAEFTANTQWLNPRDKGMDYRCLDWCISKRKNFILQSGKSVIVATKRGNLLRDRVNSRNCNFDTSVEIIDTDVRDVKGSIARIVSKYTKDKIVLLDTGADLIFGAFLFKSKVPTISLGLSLNSYFNILERNHASMLPDAYEIEANNTWLIE